MVSGFEGGSNMGHKTMEKATLRLEGMSCASCAAAIERALGKADGVLSAAVNFATDTAVVEYDSTVTARVAGQGRESVGYEVLEVGCYHKAGEDDRITDVEDQDTRKIEAARRKMLGSWILLFQ